jgi:hypothetical protein
VNLTDHLEKNAAHLVSCLERLCLLADSVTAGMTINPDDHFAFLGSCFLSKQIEHAAAVIRLGKHPDGFLVARCMLEGLWQLKWAAKDPQVRAERWKAFAYIHDWRLLQERSARGSATDPEIASAIASGLTKYGEQFVTPSARKAKLEGRELPDPYEKSWSGWQVRQLAEDAGDIDLYLSAYSDFSERHHWDPAGVASGVSLSGATLVYNGTSTAAKIGAAAVAFQCLFSSAHLLNRHFARQKDAELMDLFDLYISVGKTGASDMAPQPPTA